MPKKNVADSGFDGEILGFNNVEMTQEEAKAVVDYLAAKVDDEDAPEAIAMLGELIETCFNLGSAHTDDTKEKTVIVLAADYAASEEVDPEEDAVEDKTEEAV